MGSIHPDYIAMQACLVIPASIDRMHAVLLIAQMAEWQTR